MEENGVYQVVMTMYEFNDNGVCLNPDRIEIARHSCIKLAEHDGVWCMGYDLDYISGGVGSPCSNNWKKHQFPTRVQALAAAFKDAIAHMERQVIWYTKALTNARNNLHNDGGYGASLKQCHVVLASLKEKQEQRHPVQLSLFDEWF